MRSDKEIEDAILAVCTLAGTNFPATTDIRISTDGPSSASVTIPYYAMVEHYFDRETNPGYYARVFERK